MSWIARDRTYRIQLQGSFIGQRKTFAAACRLLEEAQRDLVKTLDKYTKKLPEGVTYIKGRDSYRVRVRGVHVVQTKDLEKALYYNEITQKKLKELESGQNDKGLNKRRV
jgi:hypothetical protein